MVSWFVNKAAVFVLLFVTLTCGLGAVADKLGSNDKVNLILDAIHYRCSRCGGIHIDRSSGSKQSGLITFSIISSNAPDIEKVKLHFTNAKAPIEMQLGKATAKVESGDVTFYFFSQWGILSINRKTNRVEAIWRFRIPDGFEPRAKEVGTATLEFSSPQNQARALTSFELRTHQDFRKINSSLKVTVPFLEQELSVSDVRDLALDQLFERLKKANDSVAPSRFEFSLLHFPTQSRIKASWLVVPVYREFYNQNIGAFLLSIANQDFSRVSPQNVHVLFNVNHTEDVDKPVALENQETVSYLQELSQGRLPTVRKESRILRQAIAQIIASGIQIHVLDNTKPGYSQKNIGRVRNDAVTEILRRVPTSELDQTLVSQMDADSRVPSNYLTELVDAFQNPKLKYALLSLHFGTEMGSDLRTYRRMIVAEVSFAIYAFQDAFNDRNPLSGSPRIVATAEALKEVGGVPLKPVAEDTELVKMLRERFGGGGIWLHHLSVETSFRGRQDGYDASHYLRKMDDPVQLTWELKHLPDLERAENDLDATPILRQYRHDRLLHYLRKRETSTRVRLSWLRMLLDDLRSGLENPFDHMDSSAQLSLFYSPQFPDYLAKALASHQKNVDSTIASVIADFPHLLKVEPPYESIILARFVAATETLLARKRLTTATSLSQRELSLDPICATFLIDQLGKVKIPN